MSSFLQFANLLGGVLFALSSIVVGSRLLWLAHRTRELPELLIGMAFAVAGCIGYFMGIACAVFMWLAFLGKASKSNDLISEAT